LIIYITMAALDKYPLQDWFKTTLSQDWNGSTWTMYVANTPDFTFPSGVTCYVVVDPRNSGRQIAEISAYDSWAKTITVSSVGWEIGAGIPNPASTHTVWAEVIISDNYQFWEDIATSINTKANLDEDNAFTAWDQTYAAGKTSFTSTAEAQLQLQNVTTTQRDALTWVENWDAIYNTTTGQVEWREWGAWVANAAWGTVADASTTVAGKVELATAAERATWASTGWAWPLVVTNDALIKTPSATPSNDENYVPILNSDGKLDRGFFDDFYWDGSDGALVVSSGTTELTFWTYNYSSITVASWATLTCSDTAWNLLLKCNWIADIEWTITVVWLWAAWSYTLFDGSVLTPWASATVWGAGWDGWAWLNGSTEWTWWAEWSWYGWGGWGWACGTWSRTSWNWGTGWTPWGTGWAWNVWSWDSYGWDGWDAYSSNWTNWVWGWDAISEDWNAGWTSAWGWACCSNGAWGGWWAGWIKWEASANVIVQAYQVQWSWSILADWEAGGTGWNGGTGVGWGGWGWGWAGWGGWCAALICNEVLSWTMVVTAWAWAAGAGGTGWTWTNDNWNNWTAWTAWSAGGASTLFRI